VRLLAELGFEVHDAKKAGHKVVKHPGRKAWLGTNFDCGHGKNPVVKNCYLNNLMRVLDEYEQEIEQSQGSK